MPDAHIHTSLTRAPSSSLATHTWPPPPPVPLLPLARSVQRPPNFPISFVAVNTLPSLLPRPILPTNQSVRSPSLAYGKNPPQLLPASVLLRLLPYLLPDLQQIRTSYFDQAFVVSNFSSLYNTQNPTFTYGAESPAFTSSEAHHSFFILYPLTHV